MKNATDKTASLFSTMSDEQRQSISSTISFVMNNIDTLKRDLEQTVLLGQGFIIADMTENHFKAISLKHLGNNRGQYTLRPADVHLSGISHWTKTDAKLTLEIVKEMEGFQDEKLEVIHCRQWKQRRLEQLQGDLEGMIELFGLTVDDLETIKAHQELAA